jgi:hypothetical protein
MKAGARQGEAETAEHATAATEAVLALAQKVHDAYVTEGQEARERLISQGQSRHDQVVSEATSRQQGGATHPTRELNLLTVPEIGRLIANLILSHRPDTTTILGWSHWRRRHQARASQPQDLAKGAAP